MSEEGPHTKTNRIVDAVLAFISLRWVRSIWMYLVRIVERMSDDHIFLSAAGIAFNTLLCFVPLTLILFYVLGLYLDSEEAIIAVHTYIESLNLFPGSQEQLASLIDSIILDFVSGSSIAGVIGAVGLIYTASALFAAVRTVLNRIFSIRDTKNLLVSKLKDFALISIIGIMFLLINIALVSISFIQGVGESVVGVSFDSFFMETFVSNGSSFVLSFLGFWILFYFVPDTRLPWRAIALSSLVAALLWGAARLGFGYYISHLWRIGKIYGSYAILVAAAIWVYYSSITMLFAAEIGEMYIERKRLKRLFTEESLQSLSQTIHQTRKVPSDRTEEA